MSIKNFKHCLYILKHYFYISFKLYLYILDDYFLEKKLKKSNKKIKLIKE